MLSETNTVLPAFPAVSYFLLQLLKGRYLLSNINALLVAQFKA